MKHKPALFALLRLHAELGGKIKQNQQEAAKLRRAMKHVEAVLKLLEPGYSLRPIAVRRRVTNTWFKRGTLLRHALDVLRKADKPLTTREVTYRLLAVRGITEPNRDQVRSLVGSVLSSLKNHQGKGVVAVGEGMPVRWAIKP